MDAAAAVRNIALTEKMYFVRFLTSNTSLVAEQFCSSTVADSSTIELSNKKLRDRTNWH